MSTSNFYAIQQPNKFSKWLGVGLGGMFGAIALGSGLIIHQLTKSNVVPVPVAVVAAAPKVAEPAPAPAAATQPVAAAEPAAASPSHASAAPSRHHASKHAAKHAAVASRRPLVSDAKAHALIAKHDSKAKRGDKDALDKLLGL